MMARKDVEGRAEEKFKGWSVKEQASTLEV
jgi:hypothetical protein